MKNRKSVKVKSKTILHCLILIIFITYCNPETKNLNTKEFKTINICFEPSEKKINFKDYFKDYKLIQIDNNLSIGNIKSIGDYNESLLIKSTSGNYRVFLYTPETKKIIKIAKIGKGPGENTNTKAHDHFYKKIGIMDYWKDKIFIYEDEVINDLKTIELPSKYQNFAWIDSNHIALFKDIPQKSDNSVEYKLCIYNFSDNIITNKFFPINNRLSWERAVTNGSRFYHLEDTLCLFQAFNDTIYNIYAGSISARYNLEHGKYELPDNIYFNSSYSMDKFFTYCKNSNFVYGIDNFYESVGFVYFTFIYKHNLYYCFHNKKNKESNAGYDIYENLFLKTNFQFSEDYLGFFPVGGNDKYLYFVIFPFFLTEKIHELKDTLKPDEWIEFKSNNKELMNVFTSSTIDDNQIIIRYEYK